MSSYRDLQFCQEARDLSIAIHRMSLRCLPDFEKYEQGSQIRRSSKSIRANIVEGYGRRRHKADYLRFLDYAFASALETIDHLGTLHETDSLIDKELYQNLHPRLDTLGRKLNSFIQSAERTHRSKPSS